MYIHWQLARIFFLFQKIFQSYKCRNHFHMFIIFHYIIFMAHCQEEGTPVTPTMVWAREQYTILAIFTGRIKQNGNRRKVNRKENIAYFWYIIRLDRSWQCSALLVLTIHKHDAVCCDTRTRIPMLLLYEEFCLKSKLLLLSE